MGIGIGVPGPVSFRDGVPVSPPIMPGWDRYPVRELLTREHNCPVVVDNDVNIMAVGERLRRRRPGHRQPAVRQDRHRRRLRHLPQWRGVPRARTGAPATSGTSRSTPTGPVCSCGNVGCLEALFGGAALARDALAAARSGASPALAERFNANGTVSAQATSPTARPRVT